MKVYKYNLDHRMNKISMPPGAELLSVGDQHGRMVLWAKVDDTADSVEYRRVFVAGTGHELPGSCGKFIGAIMTGGGNFVWHVFEV